MIRLLSEAACDGCDGDSLESGGRYPIIVYILPFAFIVAGFVALFVYLIRRRRMRERADAHTREFGRADLSIPNDALTFAIESLPTHRHRPNQEDGSGANEECRLCLEVYTEGVVLRRLPCGHTYHSACIDWWLAGRREQADGPVRGTRTCPLCKRDPLDRDCLAAAAAALRATRHRGPGAASSSWSVQRQRVGGTNPAAAAVAGEVGAASASPAAMPSR